MLINTTSPKTTKSNGITVIDRSGVAASFSITRYEIIEKIPVIIQTLAIKSVLILGMKKQSDARLMKISYNYF